jgi:hypothetical protein
MASRDFLRFLLSKRRKKATIPTPITAQAAKK